MRPLIVSALLIATAFTLPGAGQAPNGELESVAAFARLYGVVRYFYPSDAAAGLDWDRFAVLGVRRVREARSREALRATLEALFGPLGPGIEIGARLPAGPPPGSADRSLVAWRYLGPGFGIPGGYSPYRGKRTNRSTGGSPGAVVGFVTLLQNTPAEPLHGRAVRLRARVRATSRDGSGSAALWLRVDRPGGALGFFDNMGDRPIRSPEWREYAIEGSVAGDATNVAFGVMAHGAVTADFDAVDVSTRGGEEPWLPLAIEDPGFETDASDGIGRWVRAGTSRTALITRPAEGAAEGGRFLRFAAPSTPVVTAELFDSAPVAGAHVTFDLGAQWQARVRLALPDAEAAATATPSATLDALRADIARVHDTADPPDLETRLAAVVVAWSALRHFYPYWSEASVDWDAQLPRQLERAYAATTRDAQRDALRQLVADARDGHGTVVDARRTGRGAFLPIQLAVVEGQVAVTASDSADVPVGSVVSAIDGTPTEERLEAAMRLASGSGQWRRVRALLDLAACEGGAVRVLALETAAGPRTARVACAFAQPAEKRPAAVGELTGGIWYVDLTRSPMSAVTAALDQLSRARAVIFDLRGYPTEAGGQVLPHLVGAEETENWMHIARITGPFGQLAGWEGATWHVKPATSRVAARRVFLTDARAISYAESVMGYVADMKLGTIVGSATAGTNGNVASVQVPGGFTIAFTGMRVTRHDGRTPFHLGGVVPDIEAVPTLAGLRAGRDEVLERAIAIVGAN